MHVRQHVVHTPRDLSHEGFALPACWIRHDIVDAATSREWNQVVGSPDMGKKGSAKMK